MAIELSCYLCIKIDLNFGCEADVTEKAQVNKLEFRFQRTAQ